MLRIFFTAEDVARTRLAADADPLWELVLGLQMLRPQRGDTLFRLWRQKAVGDIRRAALGDTLDLVLTLTPNVGYFPDFLNPMASMHGLAAGLEAIRSTPIRELRRDMRRLAEDRPLPGSARALAEGEPATLVALTDAMNTCYDLLIGCSQVTIWTAIGRDLARRRAILARSGVEGLLNSLRPMAEWSSGELSIPGHRDQELQLDGRGIVLIPSYFCVSGPLTLREPTLPPVLVYPVERSADTLPHRDRITPPSLSALMGRTRAAILEAAGGNESSTSEIARRVGVSAASASEHLTILRQAGLLISQRDLNRMLHRLTDLGVALLNGDPQGAPRRPDGDPPSAV